MTGNYQKKQALTLQRYEAKFVIPEKMIKPVSEFASIYCFLDKYSERTEDNFYCINNLYLDTPDYLFLKRRLYGRANRFNMRIRTYSNISSIPCFFEIKQKNVNIIKKYRAEINDKNWQRAFELPGYEEPNGDGSGENSNRDLFFRLAYSYCATPKVLTQYMRKAYVSDVDDYARVTFDKDMRFQVADGYNLTPNEDKMVPLDDETIFDPACNVVLELKCYTTQVPLWMIDLIRYFNLRKRHFSKYVAGITNALNMFNYDTSLRQAALPSALLD